MWPHKDIAWWAFVISIVALVGAYPLSLLANLTSPKLQNWWAERSRASLQKRIDELRAELAEIEKFPLITETEEWTLLGIENIGKLIQYAIQLLVSIGMALIGWFGIGRHSWFESHYWVEYAWVVFLVVVNYVTYKLVMATMRDYLHERGPMARAGLRITIRRLTAKLSKLDAVKPH